MTRLRQATFFGLALAATLTLAPQSARGDDELALGVAASTSWLLTTQQWRAIDDGPLLALDLSFESDYFLKPVFGLRRGWLARSEERRELGAPFGEVLVQNELRCWGFLLGPATDLGPLRATASAGLFLLEVDSVVDGHAASPSAWALGYQLTLEGWLVDWDWGHFGAVVEAAFLAEAETALFSAGLRARFEIPL